MKQVIVKNRREAIKFANGGSIHAQRAAYWSAKGVAYRAERCPGERECRITENCCGHWWSATKTVAQKLGLGIKFPRPAVPGRKKDEMKRTTSDGKQVKITRAGRLYVDGVLTPTMSDGKPVADRVTPLNLPDRQLVGEEIFGLAHEWAFRNYRMA